MMFRAVGRDFHCVEDAEAHARAEMEALDLNEVKLFLVTDGPFGPMLLWTVRR